MSKMSGYSPELRERPVRMVVDEYPRITEVALGTRHDHQVEFVFVLDLILQGLEQGRDNT